MSFPTDEQPTPIMQHTVPIQHNAATFVPGVGVMVPGSYGIQQSVLQSPLYSHEGWQQVPYGYYPQYVYPTFPYCPPPAFPMYAVQSSPMPDNGDATHAQDDQDEDEDEGDTQEDDQGGVSDTQHQQLQQELEDVRSQLERAQTEVSQSRDALRTAESVSADVKTDLDTLRKQLQEEKEKNRIRDEQAEKSARERVDMVIASSQVDLVMLRADFTQKEENLRASFTRRETDLENKLCEKQKTYKNAKVAWEQEKVLLCDELKLSQRREQDTNKRLYAAQVDATAHQARQVRVDLEHQQTLGELRDALAAAQDSLLVSESRFTALAAAPVSCAECKTLRKEMTKLRRKITAHERKDVIATSSNNLATKKGTTQDHQQSSSSHANHVSGGVSSSFLQVLRSPASSKMTCVEDPPNDAAGPIVWKDRVEILRRGLFVLMTHIMDTDKVHEEQRQLYSRRIQQIESVVGGVTRIFSQELASKSNKEANDVSKVNMVDEARELMEASEIDPRSLVSAVQRYSGMSALLYELLQSAEVRMAEANEQMRLTMQKVYGQRDAMLIGLKVIWEASLRCHPSLDKVVRTSIEKSLAHAADLCGSQPTYHHSTTSNMPNSKSVVTDLVASPTLQGMSSESRAEAARQINSSLAQLCDNPALRQLIECMSPAS